ncbi:serine hydrolase [Glaciecola sp. SC05]|uniref:serine hydrolase n=1 Tax=Glaciecola sp. SC05 TaxID=1987355 RepID=UPI0035283DD8
MSIRAILAISFSILCMFSNFAFAQWDPEALDKTIERALEEFHTPGMSVAIVHNNQVIYEKGFGSANLEQKQAVTANTYFRIASTSKAFTAAALAILVDQEKLQWDDLVIDYLPAFRLQDSYATMHFTVEDLLTHKSGLAGGAGDSMIWPEPSGFTREEVIANLRYLTPDFQFRQSYAYSNVMYITAGELVEAVSGKVFEDFVDQYIFKPLEMQCYAGSMPEKAVNASAMGYGHNDSKGIYPVSRNAIFGEPLMSAAAGGMVCNASDMAKWISALLAPENLPFSQVQLSKMWQAHTIMSVSKTEREWQGSHFENYGLGWRLTNFGAYQHISHTGTLSGYQAFVALLPELNLGAVVLNNGSNSGARGAVMLTIMEMFTKPETQDWVQNYIDQQDEREQRYLANFEAPKASAKISLEAESIIGRYSDSWFGDLVLSKSGKDIRIESSRMINLKGKVVPFQDMTYKIIWDNQNAASNAFMHFEVDIKRKVLSARLHPFVVDQYNNHEWRDMHFVKETEE